VYAGNEFRTRGISVTKVGTIQIKEKRKKIKPNRKPLKKDFIGEVFLSHGRKSPKEKNAKKLIPNPGIEIPVRTAGIRQKKRNFFMS